MTTLHRYVALLRGINIGGHKKIKMADLRELFLSLGFHHVKTLLASGNAVFDTAPTDTGTLVETIETAITKAFGHDISVIVWAHASIQDMVSADPFAGIEVADNTRLYVTFLGEPPTAHLETPYESPEGNFRIIAATDSAVFSVLTLTPGSRTVDAMDVLAKTFGPNITTRNWNTVKKIAAK